MARGKAVRGVMVAVFSVIVLVAIVFAVVISQRSGTTKRRGAVPAGTVQPVGPSRPAYGKAPRCRLTGQNGKTVSSNRFAGKVRVVTFLFPYCTTYCPVIGRTLVRLDQQLAANGQQSGVQIVAFNVDPAGSGPKQMRAFWKQYGGDPADPHFSYLTGTPKQIRHVVTDGYHVYYKKVRGGDDDAGPVPNAVAKRAHVKYDIVHNDDVEIVGPHGRVTRIFPDGSKVSVHQLERAIKAAR